MTSLERPPIYPIPVYFSRSHLPTTSYPAFFPLAAPPSPCSSNSSIASNFSRASSDRRRVPVPPKSNIMFQESRYKTEMCRQLQELGECFYGDRCLYAHGQYELKPAVGRHPKFKTQLCTAFHTEGYCSFGSRCSFIHSKPDTDLLLKVLDPKVKNPILESDEFDNQFSEILSQKRFNLKTDDIDFSLSSHFDSSCSCDRLPIFVNICTKSNCF